MKSVVSNKNTKGYIMKLRVMGHNGKSRAGEFGTRALQRVCTFEKYQHFGEKNEKTKNESLFFSPLIVGLSLLG